VNGTIKAIPMVQSYVLVPKWEMLRLQPNYNRVILY
jgi:hypothetical protein